MRTLLAVVLLGSFCAFAQADAPLSDPGGRVRWGVSANLGWHLPPSALTLGLEGRAGYQVGRVLSVYGVLGFTGGLGVGGTITSQGATVRATGLIYGYLGALAELMLGDRFFIAGGPVIALGTLAGVSTGADSSGQAQLTTSFAAGPKPGFDVRLGLGFGRVKGAPTFRRGGFNLGLDALVLVHPNGLVGRATLDTNTGDFGAAVQRSEAIVTVTPMLMLGYDAR
jgi:hypothetical protein